MYELVYGKGGHGGPYPSVTDAVNTAHRLLRGSKTETVIYVVPRSAPVYSSAYSVRTVTKTEALLPEYQI